MSQRSVLGEGFRASGKFGKGWVQSQSSFSAKGRLQSSFQGKATTQPLSFDCEQICKSPQKQSSFGSSGLSNTKASCRKGGCQVISGFLQPSFSGSKAQQKMASNLGPEQARSFPGHKHLQNGDPRDRLSLQKGEWVMSLDFSDAYFHIPIAQRSRKFLRFHMNKVNCQFTSLPFG